MTNENNSLFFLLALAEAWKDVVLPSKSNSLYSFTDHVGSEEENREEEETATKEEDHGDGNFASADTNDNDGDGDGNDVFSPGATSAQGTVFYFDYCLSLVYFENVYTYIYIYIYIYRGWVPSHYYLSRFLYLLQ